MEAGAIHGKEALERLAFQLRSSIKAWRNKPHRKRSRRMENAWLLCWLLKDLGWVLLCWPLAWPAALLAIVLQGQDLLLQLESAPICEWVHGLATLAWLTGSSVWMTAQLLFEPVIHKDRASPWYSGSIFAANANHYSWGVTIMQAIDVAALIGLMIFYVTSFLGDTGVWSSPKRSPTGDAIRQRRAVLDDD